MNMHAHIDSAAVSVWPQRRTKNDDASLETGQDVGTAGTPGQVPQFDRRNQQVKTWYRAVGKRAFDIVFVIATLPISVPLILFLALALWIEGGVPFYRQARLGKDGKVYSILKLRTMVCNADACLAEYLENDAALREEWDTTQKLKNDPRITRVGAFLRATSVDELPQLWNVLKGEMSLVGPRPMMPDQLPLYGDAQAYFALRPGITGIWQVSDRNESPFAQRAKADDEYFHSVSLWTDIVLMVRTVRAVTHRTGC